MQNLICMLENNITKSFHFSFCGKAESWIYSALNTCVIIVMLQQILILSFFALGLKFLLDCKQKNNFFFSSFYFTDILQERKSSGIPNFAPVLRRGVPEFSSSTYICSRRRAFLQSPRVVCSLEKAVWGRRRWKSKPRWPGCKGALSCTRPTI